MRHVLVTGASSGLGKELMVAFRLNGDVVLGTTHDKEAALRDPELLFYEVGDFRVKAANAITTEKLVANVDRMFGGRLDVLINSAGTNEIRKFEDLTPDLLRYVMEVNFEAPVFLTQAFLPMLTRGEEFAEPVSKEPRATVVNIISDAAWRPMRHSLAYNCSKAALDMATRQMARELTKPYGVSFIGIRPGKMENTGMSRYIDEQVQQVRGWSKEQADEYFKHNSLTGLELDPVDVAEFVCHVVTGGMSRHLSGACIDLVG